MNKKTDDYRDTGADLGEDRAGGGRFSLRRLKTFESFKNPVFRIYFGGMVGQWAGVSMQMMVRSLLVYRVTGSGAMIGILAVAQAIPQLIISLLGGAIADRIQKKYILLIGQIGSSVVSLGIAFALATGYLSEGNPNASWILIVSAALQGAAMGFTMPATMAIIPEIVGEERVTNAVSLSVMGQTGFRLLGPALAGFLIDSYDFAAVYFLMTVTYAIASVCVLFIPPTGKKTVRKATNPLKDIVEGLRYLRREVIMLVNVIFGMCHMISGIPYMQLMPIFTEDILKVGARSGDTDERLQCRRPVMFPHPCLSPQQETRVFDAAQRRGYGWGADSLLLVPLVAFIPGDNSLRRGGADHAPNTEPVSGPVLCRA